jgi:hypothetical protein
MSRHSRTTQTCTDCGAAVRGTTLCATCLAEVATDLRAVGALVRDVQRIFTTDDRVKGSDADPLVRSRARRMVPVIRTRDGGMFCVLHPGTGQPMLEPEPLPAGAFGRSPSTRWDVDRGLGREIAETVARQTATPAREGGRSSSKPLPFNDRAATVAHRVQLALAWWMRELRDGEEELAPADVVAVAAWLLERVDRVAVHPAGGRLARDVHRAVEDLRRAVDRPADRWFMGPCDTDGCTEEHLLVGDDGRARTERRPTELYAVAGAETVTCGRCHAEYEIAERRAWLLAAAEDQLAHAELIGRAAPALGVEITPSKVRNYADRGRIVAHGKDRHGRPLYRVGDVIAVAQEVLAKRSKGARHADSKRTA